MTCWNFRKKIRSAIENPDSLSCNEKNTIFKFSE
jgi:hypothetical protein